MQFEIVGKEHEKVWQGRGCPIFTSKRNAKRRELDNAVVSSPPETLGLMI